MPLQLLRLRKPAFAYAAASLTCLMACTLVVMSFVGGIADPGLSLAILPVLVCPAVTGAVVAARRPLNPVGWLLISHSWMVTFVFGTEVLANTFLTADDDGAAALTKAISDASWPLLFLGLILIAVEFPGTSPTPSRGRKTERMALVATAILVVAGLFSRDPFPAPFDGLERPFSGAPESIAWLMLPAFFGLVVASIDAARSARARTQVARGELRLQMLWFAWGALTIPATLLVCVLEGAIAGGAESATFAAVILMGTTLPITIAVGILRHQLLDIEVVVNRTIVYGVLTLLVATLYAAVVAASGLVIGNRNVGGVVAAIAVAVAVQPVHRRIQHWVDRLVFGERVDPYAALKRLDAKLLTSPTPDAAVHAVVETVALALKLPYAAVLIDESDGETAVAMYGELGSGTLERRDLAHRGERVGALIVEVPRGRKFDPTDARFLDELSSHVGAAVHSVRLTAELQQSRKEIITAREEERRRLRRDLHDGVGPNLAAMSLSLGTLREHVEASDAELVDSLGTQVQDAIADIRRLVHDLRPPALDQYGLETALLQQANRISTSSASFSVRTNGELPALSAAVEVATYRIALEGMTNAARHAEAGSCIVVLSADSGDLKVSVEDDGIGFAPATPHGVGVRSMRERVDELGGSLEIGNRPGGGTRVIATLPLEQ